MKNLFFTAIVTLTIGANAIAQNSVTRKILLKLDYQEKPISSESCIQLYSGTSKLSLITKKGDKYFSYENGKKKGPFASLDGVKTYNCSSDDCSIFETKDINPSDYISIKDNKQYIRFKNKEFGPFNNILKIKISHDNNWFVAAIADDQDKIQVITADNKKIPVSRYINNLAISSTGKKAIVTFQENVVDSSAFYKGIDKKTLSQEEAMKINQQIQEKQKQMGEPKTWVIDSDQNKYGPFQADAVAHFSITGADNWYIAHQGQLIINGKVVKQDEKGYFPECGIYISKDGKKFAIANYEKITFNDGTSYPFPLRVIPVEENNTSSLIWISLENENLFVHYKKVF